TLLEMAFAGRCGLQLDLAALAGAPLQQLFAEEAGAVIQLATSDVPGLSSRAEELGLTACLHPLGRATAGDDVTISAAGTPLLRDSRARLQALWARTTYEIAALRDHPDCAAEEYQRV